MVTRKRPELPWRPAPVVAELRKARDAMVAANGEMRAFGPGYLAAAAVMKAVDAFAELLTGDASYFHCGMNSTPNPSRPSGGGNGALGNSDAKREREAGREPWAWLDGDGTLATGYDRWLREKLRR